MSTQSEKMKAEVNDSRLPEDATPVAYDGDTAYFESNAKDLVYVIQGGIVLAVPRVHRANATQVEAR